MTAKDELAALVPTLDEATAAEVLESQGLPTGSRPSLRCSHSSRPGSNLEKVPWFCTKDRGEGPFLQAGVG